MDYTDAGFDSTNSAIKTNRLSSPKNRRHTPLTTLDNNIQIFSVDPQNMVCSDNSEDACKVNAKIADCEQHQVTSEQNFEKENSSFESRMVRSSNCHLSPKLDDRICFSKSDKKSQDIKIMKGPSITPLNCVSNAPKNIQIRNEPFKDHYEIEEEIGRGKFAVVRKCRHLTSGLKRAAKFLRKRRKGKDCRSEVLKEVAMLDMARAHPRLVDLIEVFETSHEIILVMEFAEGGELFTKIMEEENFGEQEVKRLVHQIIEAVLFLHERNIVHLDIKPQNVLLTAAAQGNVKLCDLGFARSIHSGDDVRDIIGTPDYVAPEILGYEPIQTASDMWSVGVLTYVLLTGCSPFAGDDKQETFLNISQVNLDFPEDLFGEISREAVDFISKLLVHDPSERLTARDCLYHPWLHRTLASSPIGQRRALTPPSPDSLADEPLKKCRCQASTPPPQQLSALSVFESSDVKSQSEDLDRVSFGSDLSSCSTAEDSPSTSCEDISDSSCEENSSRSSEISDSSSVKEEIKTQKDPQETIEINGTLSESST